MDSEVKRCVWEKERKRKMRGASLVVSQLLSMLALMVLLPPLASAAAAASNPNEVPVIINFGDSNSDTGGLVALFGGQLPLPYGRKFFHKSTGRYSDGRLIIDFLCESVNSSHLSPYLEPLGSNFTNGANFAVGGAAATTAFIPVTLSVQVLQFLHFKSRSLDLFAQGAINVVGEEWFRNAIYAFDIGQNDLSAAFYANSTKAYAIERIPSILSKIEEAVKTVYENGGRKFWVHNTGPLGCLPEKLSVVSHDSSHLDSCGCLGPMNDAAKAFNAGLIKLLGKLGSEMKNATVVHTDLYAIKYDIICNHRKYGFVNPLMACCGSGGPPYNFMPKGRCFDPVEFQVCAEGSRYISWDGIHYTEAANAIVASKILSSAYSKPHVKLEELLFFR